MRMMRFGLLLYSFEHPLNMSKGNIFSGLRGSLSDSRIPIENFTYNTMDIRDQWLDLLEQIHFLGVSVSKNLDAF
jgi:hypothetical protein